MPNLLISSVQVQVFLTRLSLQQYDHLQEQILLYNSAKTLHYQEDRYLRLLIRLIWRPVFLNLHYIRLQTSYLG
nr:MAG TPA: hypothetical protein [Bacteriophage sp.]